MNMLGKDEEIYYEEEADRQNCQKILYHVFKRYRSAMCVVDLNAERYIDFNEAFLKLTGLSEAELLKKTPPWLINQQIYEQIKELFKQQDYPWDMEVDLRIRGRENSKGLLIISKIEVNGKNYALFIIREITTRWQKEKEALRLDRLNLVGQMAAAIGHEIRNPLTTVRGFLQLLSSKNKFLDYKKYFDLMISELDKANSIITEYLKLAINKIVNKKNVSINKILYTVWPLLNAKANDSGKRIELLTNSVSELSLDESEITQLIINMASNGLEAMDEGGLLTIKTYEEKDAVFLVIADQGHGIDAALIDMIGTPFVTTKSQGPGLGLAVCYSIAKRHKAIITFDTSRKGTTFYVKFKI
ncbi:ATP-binding protein [Bacillota bacterium LX-D]|nr:ATP-binding protein [Bacillota bacterium LX-D]